MIKFDIVCDISAVDFIRLYHNFNIGCRSDALLTCHLLLKDQFQLQSSSYFEFMSVKKKNFNKEIFLRRSNFHRQWLMTPIFITLGTIQNMKGQLKHSTSFKTPLHS